MSTPQIEALRANYDVAAVSGVLASHINLDNVELAHDRLLDAILGPKEGE